MGAFIFLFLFRLISGIQNGFGYAKYKNGVCITTIVMMILSIVTTIIAVNNADQTWQTILIILAGGTSTLSSFGVGDSFLEEWKILSVDIHFWEMLVPIGVSIIFLISGSDIIAVLTSVYPALILHKAAINIGGFWDEGNGWPGVLQYFWHHGTDDPTGKTFSIPILGIKIPRLGLPFRLILAGISIGLMTSHVVWGVLPGSIYDLFNSVLS